MEQRIKVVECGPRDGWQNLKQMLSFDEKIKIIDSIIDAGAESIEVTSFVSPKAIPQMADAAELAKYCLEKYPNKEFIALIPNLRGAQNAWQAGIRHVTYVVSASESHNMANIKRTHEQSLNELAQIIAEYPELDICIGLATSFGCPFEGIPDVSKVVSFAKKLYGLGIRKISLADTIGIADPQQTRDTVKQFREEMPDCELQVHIHDTRGMGLACTLAAIESGVHIVQSTLGGLGGCPFAPGASGNTATEDLVYMLDRMGYETGVDFEAILDASKEQKKIVDGIYSGHQMNIDKNACCRAQ